MFVFLKIFGDFLKKVHKTTKKYFYIATCWFTRERGGDIYVEEQSYHYLYDAKPQGPARRCEPGPHVHFWAVSHVTGISGIFRFILTVTGPIFIGIA